MHCVKSVQIRSYFSAPYLVTFHTVIVIDNLKADNCFRLTQVDEAK